MQKNDVNKINISLPEIVSNPISIDDKNWSVVFYREFGVAFIDNDGEWKQGFAELLKRFVLLNSRNDFRELITFESVPFLAGFFYGDREIRLCSMGAARELFLLESIEGSGNGNGDVGFDGNSVDYNELKAHIDKIASLDDKLFPSDIEKLTIMNGLPDFINSDEFSDVNESSKQITERLLDGINRYKPSIFERVTDFSLNLSTKYALLRIHLLKFLAILPALDYDSAEGDVKRIFLESMRRLLRDSCVAKREGKGGENGPVPFYLEQMFKASSFIVRYMPASLFTLLIRRIVRIFASRFIAGETIGAAKGSLDDLRSTMRDATIDQLGELVVSEKEADRYCSNVINLINGVASQIKKGEKNESGILKANVSIKVSALCSDFRAEAFDYVYDLLAPRLKWIFVTAREEEVFINVDAEHYKSRDLVFDVLRKVLLETEELKGFSSVGIAVQTYLRDAAEHLEEIIELAKARNITMPIRLVKGAYWDAETIGASAFNYNAPEFLNKVESDLFFRQLAVVIMENHPHVQLCLASHNPQDHSFVEALREVKFPHTPRVEHQCLYMTCESLSVTIAGHMGWVTRNYVPIGSLLMGMGYLVRRIIENSSIAGVLTVMRSQKKQEPVKEPHELFVQEKERGNLNHDMWAGSFSSRFFNTPPVRLYMKDQMSAVTEDLQLIKESLGGLYNCDSGLNGEIHNVYSPSVTGFVVGQIKYATVNDASSAIETVYNARKRGVWSMSSPLTRASILLKAASELLLRRVEFAAFIVNEGGKCIGEAAGDVDEAIDFLNFYARGELRFLENHANAVPRGVIVVIPPWNFPLAIPCGMVAAALVAGNTVLLKSSRQTPLVAQMMVELLHWCGVPEDVLIHLPGSGDDVGSVLVNSPKVNGVVFTGSKRVGTWIYSQSMKRMTLSENEAEERFPVKVVTEMGGKNPIIVTANAELDETVSASLYSCFGHAGQKCSAASRIIVDERVIGRFTARFAEACNNISIGESYKFSSVINPVICEHDKQRLINDGKSACAEALNSGGKVIVNRIGEDLPGYCVGPLVLQIPSELALQKDSYAHKELFGPIVHIIPYKTIEQAVLISNSIEYGLTAGVFSQSQDDIDFIIKRLEAGNLYVNRGCTGARVGIEPFGGFKHSGTGPKAGHDDYLPAFHLLMGNGNSNQENRRSKDNLDKKCRGSEGRGDSTFGVEIDGNIIAVKRGLYKVSEIKEDIFEYAPVDNGIISLAAWLGESLTGFLSSRSYNNYVPGQLSYNDYSMIKGKGVLVALGKYIHINSIYNMASAIAVGSSIKVLAKSAHAFDLWERVLDCFLRSGVPNGRLSLIASCADCFNSVVDEPDSSFVIVDGNEGDVESVLISISDISSHKSRYMRSLHTPMDGPNPHDWEAFAKQFVFARSIAINTMRHGAPLDVNG